MLRRIAVTRIKKIVRYSRIPLAILMFRDLIWRSVGRKLVVPPALVLFGTLLPKFGRRLGKKDRKFILEHVQQTLATRIEGSDLQYEAALSRG